MLRWKNKKRFAGILAAVLLMQTVAAPATAEEVSAAAGSEVNLSVQEAADQGNLGGNETEPGDLSQNDAEPEDPDPSIAEPESPGGNDAELIDPDDTGADQPGQDENIVDDIILDEETDSTEQAETEQESDMDLFDETESEGELARASGTIELKSTADFINLSLQPAETYQNAAIIITRNDNTPFDLTQTVDGNTFQGLGDQNHPFQGTITITSYQSGIDIPINRSFFNYLDQSARIGEGLYLKSRGNMTAPLLAEHFVNRNKGTGETDGSSTETTVCAAISLIINADQGDEEELGFGGIIGTMEADSALTLSVQNRASAQVALTGTANLGFFCNTMEAGAALTISAYTDANGTSEIAHAISSTGGHVGGLIGEMKAGASLTVEAALCLTGSVTATADGMAAGGLVGTAENPKITLDQPVTRKGSVRGVSESGGYIGRAVYADASVTPDLVNLGIQDLALEGGNHTGGVFGVLNVDCPDGGIFTIKHAVLNGITHSGSGWQFGGLIGQYSASSQSSTLRLEAPVVSVSKNGSVTAMGGLIGFVAGSGADHALAAAGPSYVEIAGAAVSVNLTNSLNAGGCFGGLVGELGSPGGAGHVLSVSGTTVIQGSDNGYAPGLGGILGKAAGGALRISGTTDLSAFSVKGTGTAYGQIAGEIDGTVVYAMGSGSGNGGEGYDWKFIRPQAVSVSDVGSYGEVIRLDGSSLTEGGSNSADGTALFCFDPSSHQFSVVDTGTVIGSKRDLAALAIRMQQGRDQGLLSGNITVDSSLSGQTIDLSGTGIYAMLRDNGSQSYSGTFEGNGCTIRLAAGEAYGYMADGSPAANSDGSSATVGIGQLYNHPRIGFFPYCNGTVQNLTLDGSVYFHNIAQGTDVFCGTVTGYTDGATFRNVTVKTATVYRDGAGGGDMGVISIGGLAGRAGGAVAFDGCSMQGSISSASGCWNFAIGGYLAAGENGVSVSVTDCGISGASIVHSKFSDSSDVSNTLFGGLIGCLDGSVTISGLTIDRLAMSSYAAGTAGGLLGYYWRKADNTADSVTVTGLTVKNCSLSVEGKFGGLIYSTDEYWKIGDGTQEGAGGIHFAEGNTFQGSTDADNPSALLICSAVTDEANKRKDKAYIEIRKDGLVIDENAVTVRLSGGDYFDDMVGKTKYGGNGTNAVLSIGLTALDAGAVTLIDQNGCNTWRNSCTVNGSKGYINKNTRYYYNVDYYRRQVEGTPVTDIDTPGKLLLRSLYIYAQENLKQYFVKGNDDLKLTGEIDLTGVSYYPMARALTIQDATVTFDYENMNANTEKTYSDANLQHYQMQTGLFSEIVQKFTVTNLTLRGTFGTYEDGKAGALICDYIAQETGKTDQAGITISRLTLDGIRCKEGEDLPLLINAVGSNTAVSMNDVTYTRENYTEKTPVAAALMGQVGSETAQKISLEFANMDLNRKDENALFRTAIFATAFRYGDGASGGSYNFETTTEKVTFGLEISNGVKSSIRHNRNSYSEQDGTGQVWYLDTFGNTTAGSYVGADGRADSPQDFSGYLPYIGYPEDAKNSYYELDVNQKAVYLVDGCGTYGHPWIIQDVSSKDETVNIQTLFTGEDQMMTVMKLLDNTSGNGVALKINKTVLQTKLQGQGDVSVHTEDTDDDVVIIKHGDSVWLEAEQKGNRYQEKPGTDVYSVSNEAVMAYLRNGYFLIKEDLTLNAGQFTGFGSEDVSRAFSGVIVGDTPGRTITLTGENKTGAMGGLIRYSQGSVVKNLTVVLDQVTFAGSSARDFFGGVIGWVIGGDNIIDGVTLTVNSVNKGSAANYTAVGGYVGMVGGYTSVSKDAGKKGGGIVFRHISSAGLTAVSGQATDTEVSKGNTYYYWNPYVGRVFDGYACAEEATCGKMGDNTDKNYKIPKLNGNDKLKIQGNQEVSAYKISIYPYSTIKIDSEQAIWILSAIVNSGFGAKVSNEDYKAGSNFMDASYYGRTRTGTYDGVGSAGRSEADGTDEKDYWGGRITAGETEIDRRNHSASYLSTYIISSDVDAKAAAYSLTSDSTGSGRNIVFKEKDYDLRSYGNGFRGIGYGYGDPTTKATLSVAKARALRLKDPGNDPAIQGNEAVVHYSRTVNEYSGGNEIYVTQAGFFTQCLANSSVNYTVENLSFQDVILKRNISRDGISLGVAFARDGAYSPNKLIFDHVTAANITLDQADRAAGLFGYMSSSTTGNKQIKFKNCSVTDMTAGVEASSVSYKMNHCGAFIGRSDNAGTSPNEKERTVEFEDCTAENITMYNVQNGGLFGGYIAGSCTIKGGSAKTGMLTARTGGGGGLGGLVGMTDAALRVTGTEEAPVTVADIKMNGTTVKSKGVNGYSGGLAGYAGSASIRNVVVSQVKIAAKNMGGMIGCVGGNVSAQNVEIRDSYLANCKDKGGNAYLNTGGLIGTLSGSLDGYQLLSKNNVVGYLLKGNEIANSFDNSKFDSLSDGDIGLQLNDGTYVPYSSLAADAVIKEDSPCGIWVGHANGNKVRLTAVSCHGDYSAVKNIGAGKDGNSYVIYADYTGEAEKSSEIGCKPDAVITAGSTRLTGDGAAMGKEKAVRDCIISDTLMEPSLMKGYYGGDRSRSLDAVMKQFGSGGGYQSRLSCYKTEDSSYNDGDFPILILHAATRSELNGLINDYISILTNTGQTQEQHYYASIAPTTYRYENGTWSAVASDEQTMAWTAADGVKINRGKYDNNKNQITVLDVSYTSPVSEEDTYHLYIPVLVKKLMDVKCSVKIVNGAVGYELGNIGTKATLNSFGENYTAQISYTYQWMVSEWQSLLENGDSLLWNFDKTVALGEFQTLDRSTIHLTVVDRNTHGSQTSYYQSTLADLIKDGILTEKGDRLDLRKLAGQGHAAYICDLLPLTAAENAEGTFRAADAEDPAAVLRIWDEDKKAFVYYAPKTSDDPQNTTYYTVNLNTECGANEILPVKEQYDLVMNCTQGSDSTPMINTKVELNQTYANAQIPTKVTGTCEQVYIVGDFYQINSLSLNSVSADQSTEMKSGSNDTIRVNVSSRITAAAKEEEFGQYVNNRAVYYQYFVQLVDRDGKPVERKGAVSVASLTMEKTDANGTVTSTRLNPVTDLDSGNGFTTQFGENGCFITVRALGNQYTGATITAELDFSYSSAELNEQFPSRTSGSDSTQGVQFKVNAVMAYQQDSLGSSCITAATKPENKLYYRIEEGQAKLTYDSCNITSKDGNTSQLGLNGRENNDAPMEIRSRALFDAADIPGLNLDRESADRYPYYLEGELMLARKTDAKQYQDVLIGSYLSDFMIESGGASADTTSAGLGLTDGGSRFRFRIRLTKDQVSEIMNNPVLINITYKVKTGADLVDIDGSQYANYKVTLSATLKNQKGQDLLTADTSDYLIYTNAKVYLGIIGVTDVGGEQQ